VNDGLVSSIPHTWLAKSNIDPDITFLSGFSAISTLGSIIQQIHYNTSWAIVKQDDYNKALKAVKDPSLGITGIANPTDRVLYLIRTYTPVQPVQPALIHSPEFYCYNVMSLNVLFW
jgi:hypothetical protein